MQINGLNAKIRCQKKALDFSQLQKKEQEKILAFQLLNKINSLLDDIKETQELQKKLNFNEDKTKSGKNKLQEFFQIYVKDEKDIPQPQSQQIDNQFQSKYEYKGIIGVGYDKKKVQAEKQAAENFLSNFIKTFTYVYKYEQKIGQNQQYYNQLYQQNIPDPDQIKIRETDNTKGIVDNKDKEVHYYYLGNNQIIFHTECSIAKEIYVKYQLGL